MLGEPSPAGTDSVPVRVNNGGPTAYAYRTLAAACDLEYYTGDGHRFSVPEAKDCGFMNEAPLDPGTTTTLFVWHLRSCGSEPTACLEGEPLPAGTYVIRGTFYPYADLGDPVRIGTAFRRGL